MTPFVYSAPALIVPLLRISRNIRTTVPTGKARLFSLTPRMVALVCAFVADGGKA